MSPKPVMDLNHKANTYLINHGLYFDGSDQKPRIANLLIENGTIKQASSSPIKVGDDIAVIDAKGKWVMPGFLDTHTHYDAEVLIQPGLKESVRHGVTTAVIGSCSISMILSEPLDCSDLFTRVESVPREQVLPILEQNKRWSTVGDYVDFYDQHPLGPNIASFLGHSDLRTAVMGLGRATRSDIVPTEAEMQTMTKLLKESMDAGLLGLSTMTTQWDKVDGDRFRSVSLPSTYAKWKEFKRFNKVLRAYGRIHQGAPNIVTKWNTALFFWESLGLWRKQLKTTLITLMDPKATPSTYWLIAAATRFFNLLKADFKWQALPNVFEVYADGMDLVVFEEFGSGEAALHLKDELERNALLKDQSYRRRFRKDYDKKWGGRVWQRDFYDAKVKSCPNTELEGLSFGEIADTRQLHPADLFLDLVVEFGSKLRWHTVIANDRPKVLERIVKNKDAVISFADSGAHIRNMAFYNFPLRLLKMSYEKTQRGENDFPIERAVYKLTGELADWFGLNAGYIKEGCRADLCIVNPEALSQDLDNYHEAPMEGFTGLDRMVNRNDGVIEQVFVNGLLAFEKGRFNEKFGKQKGYGQFLRSQFNDGQSQTK